MASALKFIAVFATGFALMFVAHLAALLNYGFEFGFPDWWGYLVIHPAATWAFVRWGEVNPSDAALGLCLAPALYFLAFGVAEGNWRASDTALLGVAIAFVLCLVAGIVAGRRSRATAESTS